MQNIPDYSFFPLSKHDESSNESFCRVLAQKLAVKIRPKLKLLYNHKLKTPLKEYLGREPTPKEIATKIKSQTEGKLWYRLRTDNQDRMYRTTSQTIKRESKNIYKKALISSGGIGSLKLNPTIQMPTYLTKFDIHRKPGGYHSHSFKGDISAGAQYDKVITIHNMGSQGINNDDPGKSIAVWIRKNFPELKPLNILDLGCTIGNNTLPYKQAFPSSNVFGIDVSEPCIRYAHARASELGIDIKFHQENAEKTSFPEQYFDLIVSRILLHETSTKALRNIITECNRLLKPGGIMIHSDAPQFDTISSYDASLRDWDINCNNEPFMMTLYNTSLKDLYSKCGFDEKQYIQEFIPSLFIIKNKIDINATPGFRQSYFLTGSIKTQYNNFS